jgi:malectin (di-glucose binding ER protein)
LESAVNQAGGFEAEREALRVVVESKILKRSPNLIKLLQYICERYFEQDTADLKEYTIAVEVFNRAQAFDGNEDSIVRVEAHRLRKKLREFYEGEGSNQPLAIVIPTGQYAPEFVPQDTRPALVEDLRQLAVESTRAIRPEILMKNVRLLAAFFVLLTLVGVAVVYGIKRLHRVTSSQPQQTASSMAATYKSREVHLRCGYMKDTFRDEEGTVWLGDRYFVGGYNTELANQYIAGTRSPELYLTLRSGSFSYNIPVEPGAYELRLHFAETTYSPASTLGGGENSRVFNVTLNGKPLLDNFDIVADQGANVADVRVFKGVHPGSDGFVHLAFSGSIAQPIVNAIELLPTPDDRLTTVRMVAQDAYFTNSSGSVWTPDNYFLGGKLAFDKVAVTGSEDPGLFLGQRYGNFSYVIPVAPGRYKLTLYFAETYWGTPVSGTKGVGSRVFDVLCNGIALERNIDIVKEVGVGKAMQKTFNNLMPNAQGKLHISFVPVRNYAVVNAIEVEEQ